MGLESVRFKEETGVGAAVTGRVAGALVLALQADRLTRSAATRAEVAVLPSARGQADKGTGALLAWFGVFGRRVRSVNGCADDGDNQTSSADAPPARPM